MPGVSGAAMGALRAADGGTLFLGRIDSMALEMQQLLLDVLASRQVIPVGGSQPSSFDVRIIASSLGDLQKEVQGRCFLPELYTLVEAVSIQTVELCQRREDIAPLAEHFLTALAEDYDEPRKQLARDAVENL